MDDTPEKRLEQDFQQRQETLYDFYKPARPLLSEEEIQSLTPIYNSLLATDSRYGEQTLLAEGGEKRIFRTYDRRLDRFVAMAYALQGESIENQEQFLREARLTANIVHPNIVPIHNMGVDIEGKPFFSMELVPGDSLGDILKKIERDESDYREKYTMDVLLGIYLKVCDAIAYAHSRKVLHLDIKPENIRVGQFGEVLVCDWGMARIINQEEEETQPGQLDADVLNDMTLSGTMKGTPGFMAPEQTVQGGEKTPKTDIYALGALLYKILTDEIPVLGSSANEVIENTQAGNIIPPRKRRADRHVPKGLAAVAMRAMALDPADRYGSTQALQMEIRRYMTGFPTDAERAGPISRLSLLTLRHRMLTLWFLIFFVVLSAVVSANLMIIQKKHLEAEDARQTAERNFALYLSKEVEAEELDAALESASFLTSKSLGVLYPEERLKLLEEIDLTGMAPSKAQIILERMGHLKFMLQRFNASATTYGELEESPETEPLWQLAKRYGTIKPRDRDLLPDLQLAELLSQRNTVKSSMAYPMYHYHTERKKRFSPKSYMPLASIMLGRVNGIHDETIPHVKLTQTEEGYHLDLSETPYTTYSVPIVGSYRKNILQPLHLHSLDISNSTMALVKEVVNLQLKELRMVNVMLEPRDGLPNMLNRMGVEKVILGEGDYPKKIIRKIQSLGIQVVEEDSNTEH
ncbi:Serine/threonine-protein kinase PknD [Pontiella sulfatireligans]|uniref:Serine/threonine-protein kinase PknD n=2 Tax=Pontiella sulfatireligans TaxID=2750658 RepID=A0A6C2UEN5_9BACT|nr:Serine/threonine-protein kinase PknD [Pontiella sulfatireligans]